MRRAARQSFRTLRIPPLSVIEGGMETLTIEASMNPNSTSFRARSPSGPTIPAAAISFDRISAAFEIFLKSARWTVEYGEGN